MDRGRAWAMATTGMNAIMAVQPMEIPRACAAIHAARQTVN